MIITWRTQRPDTFRFPVVNIALQQDEHVVDTDAHDHKNRQRVEDAY